MVESKVQSLSCPMLTESQIQTPISTTSLLDTTADCLQFVTEFFGLISQSAPHIYHSALLLAPKSSIVSKLYSQWIHSPVERVVTGMPTSWDSCMASARGHKFQEVAWSPCGQLIAVGGDGPVWVPDSVTLGRVSVLNPPSHQSDWCFEYPTFSPDGCLFACFHQL